MKGSDHTMPANGAEPIADSRPTQPQPLTGRVRGLSRIQKQRCREARQRAAGVIGKTVQRQTERNASFCPAEATTVVFRLSVGSVVPKPKPSLMRFVKG
jgi:hypothetical protein